MFGSVCVMVVLLLYCPVWLSILWGKRESGDTPRRALGAAAPKNPAELFPLKGCRPSCIPFLTTGLSYNFHDLEQRPPVIRPYSIQGRVFTDVLCSSCSPVCYRDYTLYTETRCDKLKGDIHGVFSCENRPRNLLYRQF